MKKIFLLLSFVISLSSYSQFIVNPYAFTTVVDDGEMTPPTFIQEAETVWNTSADKSTASFAVQTGDVLVAYSVLEDHSAEVISMTGGGLSWTQQQLVNVTDYTKVYIWTAVATSTTSITVTFLRGGGDRWFGGNVLTFRGSSGVGASSQATGSGTASVGLTTTEDNSAIVVVSGDWNAADGTSRVWLTVNSITPSSGAGTEPTYFRDGSRYSTYAGRYTDAGSAGSKTIGVSAPGGQKFSIAAIEIKGN